MPDRPLTLEAPDVQAQKPSLQVGLSRVGVTGVEKVIRISQHGVEQLFWAKLDCFVDLAGDQKGAHMSRFEEVVNEAIGTVVLGESTFRAEDLAQRIAELVRERQGARRAEVTIAARYPEHKPAPVSGIDTQEIYTLYGMAVASERGTRRLVGVAAQGMTACPCAQQLVGAAARARLLEQGFGDDEVAVVEKAHRRPRFVEDCVREMLEGVLAGLPQLPDGAFVSARQENLETIHQHNVAAERYGTLAELRRELSTGEMPTHHTTLREWLDTSIGL